MEIKIFKILLQERTVDSDSWQYGILNFPCLILGLFR